MGWLKSDQFTFWNGVNLSAKSKREQIPTEPMCFARPEIRKKLAKYSSHVGFDLFVNKQAHTFSSKGQLL